MNLRLLLPKLLLLGFLPSAQACLWDNDTLEQERARMPGMNEMIAGYFPRHSQAFYEWRLQDRLKRLPTASEPLPLMDDIAVAHLKLGHLKEAIEWGEKTLKLKPDRYESLSNLGTFLLFDGQFHASLEKLRLAVKINPQAHFGRENIQIYLVEYLLKNNPQSKSLADIKLPMTSAHHEGQNFSAYAADRLSKDKRLEYSEALAQVRTGVLGMMRFAKYDHPILMESLGPYYIHKNKEQRLRARAYLQAAAGASSEEARKAYRELASKILQMQQDVPLSTVESAFATELVEGAKMQAEIAADEARWIAAGVDVEAEFSKKWMQIERHLPENKIDSPWTLSSVEKFEWVMKGCLGIFIGGVLLILWRRYKKAQATPSA